MSLFKLLFSRKFRTLRRLLFEVRMFWPPSQADDFLSKLRFFSFLFYSHGFLGVNQIPAFPNAYKNITPDVFQKTYIALPLYFALRSGLQDSSFTSVEQLVVTLSQKYPTLDGDVLQRLASEWKEANLEELDRLLYEQFKAQGVFRKVFTATDTEVEKWFGNFLNQAFGQAMQFSVSSSSASENST